VSRDLYESRAPGSLYHYHITQSLSRPPMATPTSNENFDPHSLPRLSNLLPHPTHKRNNKPRDHNASLGSPGLRDSFLHNVTTHQLSTLESSVEIQLPMPPTSQPVVLSRDKTAEETRLPISPPPEEEIRIKELVSMVSHFLVHPDPFRLECSRDYS
jgi:hypothetical protein